MSRKKLLPTAKKRTISIRIPDDLASHLDDIENKSKFFEWLLIEHFNEINMDLSHASNNDNINIKIR